MNTTNLISLFIILSCLFFWWQDRRNIKYNHFLVAKTVVETLIMQSHRENRIHAILANDMIEKLRPAVKGKRRRRELDQLLILWRSKFKHLFND